MAQTMRALVTALDRSVPLERLADAHAGTPSDAPMGKLGRAVAVVR